MAFRVFGVGQEAEGEDDLCLVVNGCDQAEHVSLHIENRRGAAACDITRIIGRYDQRSGDLAAWSSHFQYSEPPINLAVGPITHASGFIALSADNSN